MTATFLPRTLFTRAAFHTCRPCTLSQTAFTATKAKAIRPLSTFTTTRTARPPPSPPQSTTLSHTKLATQSRRTYASAAPTQPLANTQRSTTAAPPDLLTWDQFFATRSRRRYINLGMGASFAVAAAVFGSPLIGALGLDASIAQATGVEELVVVIGGSLAVAVVGWFVGRTFGSIAFSLYARQGGWQRIFMEKEKSFFARIKRYRADPSSSSPQNPIPDYYGEKISSVKDYRRWLKDQRAFTKKMYRGVR